MLLAADRRKDSHLTLKGGRPEFLVRSDETLSTVSGNKRIVGGWHHVAGVLDTDKSMKLYVDGELVGEGKASGLISKDPAQPLEVGLDGQTAVGEYNTQLPFTGLIDEVRLYFLAADAEQIAATI